MPAKQKTAAIALTTVTASVALALPASIIFGRGALAVALAVAVIAMGVAAAAGLRWQVFPRQVRAPLLVAAVIAIAWLPAVVGSLEPAISAGVLLRSLATVALGAALAAFLAQEHDLRAGRLFIAGMAVAELFAVIALFVSPSMAGFRAHGTAMPHLFLKASASGVACALPLLIYGGWRMRGWWRGMALACVPLGFAIMYGTSSKSSLAGLLAAITVGALVALTRGGRLRNLVIALTLAAGLVGAAVATAAKLAPQAVVGGYHLFAPVWLVDQHRQVIWQFTLDRFRERPWFGWGLSVINTAPGAGAVIPELNAEYIPSHPHNWMVQTLAESGIGGFVPLLAVVLAVAWAGVLAYRRHGTPEWLAWLALWLTYWSAGAFNFSMWNASWQTSGMVLAALVGSQLIRRPTP